MTNWIYKNSNDNTSRFLLGEIGLKNLICIGINPSTATPESLDNTLKKVKKIAYLNGYDGWIMLNVYPQRATNPNQMHNDIDYNLHNQNLEEIRNLLSKNIVFDIWASWGTLINKRPYLKSCLNDVATTLGLKSNWLHISDLTRKSHPRHPLYVAHASVFNQFDIENYIK